MSKIYVARFERFDYAFRPALKETVEVAVWHEDKAEAWAHLHLLDRPLENKSSWNFYGWRRAEFMGEVPDES